MRRAGAAAAIAIVAASGVLASGWPADGARTGPPGLVYGAKVGDARAVFLRLRPDRARIANLLFEWEIPASGCTKPGLASELRSNMTWTGGELGHPIIVRDGRFATRSTSEYSYEGYAFVEKARIAGRFVARRVEGTIDVTLSATRRDGPGGFSCVLPPTRFTAAD